MRTVEHTIDVAAAPSRVWQVLTDTGAYPDWNPFMTRLEGPLTVGARLTVTLRLGARTMTFRPALETIEPERLLRWRGRLGVPGLFDGTHELQLEPSPDGGTRFTQRERFGGLLVPLLSRVLSSTETGFAAMNTALAARAAGPDRTVSP